MATSGRHNCPRVKGSLLGAAGGMGGIMDAICQ
jgi:hypothetical protein